MSVASSLESHRFAQYMEKCNTRMHKRSCDNHEKHIAPTKFNVSHKN